MCLLKWLGWRNRNSVNYAIYKSQPLPWKLYWKYKQIDIEKFKKDIKQSCLYAMTVLTCDENLCDMEMMAAQYNIMLHKIIDEVKTKYYPGKIQECAWDQKTSFEIIKSLTKQEHYPDSDCLKDLVDTFDDCFVMKIQKIRTKLDSQNPEPITIPRVPVEEEDMFLSFHPLPEDDVRNWSSNRQINMQQWPNSNMALEGMPRLAPSYIHPFSKQIPSDWILPWWVEI